jgi:hypothetical protein
MKYQLFVFVGVAIVLTIAATSTTFAVQTVRADVATGCTGNPHSEGETGNPHDEGHETGNPHDAKGHLNHCPGNK